MLASFFGHSSRTRTWGPRIAILPLEDTVLAHHDEKFLFTSESVTKGHPDKIADQISDAVLDSLLTDDPKGRVACETLVTTGLVVVAGEITTTTYVRLLRNSPAKPSRKSATPAPNWLRRRNLRRHLHHPQPISRHRHRRRYRRRRRPGPDVRLRLRRNPRADAHADPTRPQPHAQARRSPQAECRQLAPPRRQIPGHHRIYRWPSHPRAHRRHLHAAHRKSSLEKIDLLHAVQANTSSIRSCPPPWWTKTSSTTSIPPANSLSADPWAMPASPAARSSLTPTAAAAATAAALLRQRPHQSRPLRLLHGPLRRQKYRRRRPGHAKSKSSWATPSASLNPFPLSSIPSAPARSPIRRSPN